MKLSIVLLACVCSLSGCITTAMLVSGADGHTPDFDTLKITQLKVLEAGDDLTVVKKDGSIEKGQFSCIEQASAECYARTYNAFLLHNASAMQPPRLGDIVFALATGKRIGPSSSMVLTTMQAGWKDPVPRLSRSKDLSNTTTRHSHQQPASEIHLSCPA